MDISVTTIDSVVRNFKAEEIILPGNTDQFRVLPGDSILLLDLDIGTSVMRLKVGEEWISILLTGGGIVEIRNNKVLISTSFAKEGSGIEFLV